MTSAENIPSLLGLVSPWSIYVRPGLGLHGLLATVQAKTVPHVGAVKPEVPTGSCLLSSRNGLFGRGDWAVHSVVVVKGRRQGHRESHVLHHTIPVKLFASSWAREELTHCWECSTFQIILCLYIWAYCWCCFKPGPAQAVEGEIFLSDWKIWTWSHQTYLVVKRGFQGSPRLCRRFTSKETNGRIQARKKTAQMPPTAGTSPCSLSRQC